MRTFSCGVEEPLRSNEQLYSIDERSRAIALATFSDKHLHRYSFVPPDDSCSDAEFLPVVAKTALALGGIATWLVAFLKLTAASPLRSRALKGRLAKKDWHTIEGADVYLATKLISFDDEQNLVPEDADPKICGWTILLGQPPDDKSLVDGKYMETLHMLALTHRMQPSPEFLAACGGANLAVAYIAKDSRERIGLVVVSPRELSSMILTMQRDGLVGSVLSGPDAPQVWRN